MKGLGQGMGELRKGLDEAKAPTPPTDPKAQ